MSLHLEFGKHLKGNEAHAAVARTYLGQAHIAGTGPEGKTCRECVFWHIKKHRKLSGGGYETVATHPGYFGKKHGTSPCEVKKARCNRPIANKANRLIPHDAGACRLFEQEEKPLPPKKEAKNV
jgi:hypothetical protein